jgi:hypothetical protein
MHQAPFDSPKVKILGRSLCNAIETGLIGQLQMAQTRSELLRLHKPLQILCYIGEALP